MLPVLFKIGPVPIHTYGLMIAVGFLTALHFISKDAVKAGIDPKVLGDCALWVLPIGIAGTRLLHIIMFHDQYTWSEPLAWFAVWKGGLVFQGGPPPVLLFCYFYVRRYGVDFWKGCDVCFPYLALGHAIGRIGCFFYGCCYGAITSLPWGIRFPRVPSDTSVSPPVGSPAYLDHLARFSDMSYHDLWSKPVHPTQLYGFVALVGLCLILLALRKYWNPFDGFTLPAYLVLYSGYRFLVEFIRDDHNPRIGPFSMQQVIALTTIVVGFVLFLVMRRYLTRRRA